MSYTPTPSKKGPSGKYDTHTRSTQTSSYPNIQAATGQGSRSYELKAGDKTIPVTVETGSSYPSVDATRKAMLQQAANQGSTLTEQQKSDLANNQNQPITVYIDKAAVERYNQMAAEQGIGTASQYFEKVLGAEAPNPKTSTLGFYVPEAPRTSTREETSQVNKGFDNSKLTITEDKEKGFSFPPPFKPDNRPWEEQTISTIETGYDNLQANLKWNYFMGPILINFAKGMGETPLQIINTARKEPWELFNVMGGIAQASGEFVSETASGDFPAASKILGGALAASAIYGKMFGMAKGAFVDFGNELKFAEVTSRGGTVASENPSFRTSFWKDYGLEDIAPKQTVPPEYYYIPTEHTELGKNLEIVKSGELNPGLGETLPGTYLEASQPTSAAERAFYKTFPNVPPELQTRLSNQKNIPGRAILTAQDRLSLANERGEQTTLETGKAPKKDFFQSQEFRARTLQSEANKAALVLEETRRQASIAESNKEILSQAKGQMNDKLLALQPAATATLFFVEEIPRYSEILKAKYKAFREQKNVIGQDIVISEIASSPLAIMTLRMDLDTTVNQAPIITGITMQGTRKGLQQKEETAQLPKLEIGIGTKTGTRARSNTIPKIKLGQLQITQSEQSQSQATQQANIPIQFTGQETITRQQSSFQYPETEKVNKTFEFLNPRKNNEESQKGLFSVEVRRRGRFGSIGSFEQPSEAYNAGLTRVRAGAGASFRIIDLIKNQVYQPSEESVFDISPSRREAGVYIQKRKNRISSFGEKAEITYKGIAANRGRSKKMKL